MKIYIIRHGETASNEKGLMQGLTDDVLNESGRLLAKETGKALCGVKFDAVYSSPLKRARETAEILLRESGNDQKILFDDRIREISIGDYEKMPYKNVKDPQAAQIIGAYFRDPLTAPAFPNGEHVNDVIARTQAFLRELAGKGYETVLVSTHGCALRCMLNFLYDDPTDFWHGHVPLNCVVNVVEAKNGEMKLVCDDLVLYDKSLTVDRYIR